MTAHTRRFVWHVSEVADLAIMFICLLGAVSFFHEDASLLAIRNLMSAQVHVSNVLWALALSIIWHLVFVVSGMYDSRRLISLASEIFDTAKTTLVCVGVYYLASPLFHRPYESIGFVAVFWFIAFSVMVLYRLGLQATLRLFRLNNRNLRYLLIVGTNERARRFGHKVLAKPVLGYRLVGFVDNPWEGTAATEKEGFTMVSTLDGLDAYLRHSVIDEVFIALPVVSHYRQIEKVLNACEEHGIPVHYAPSFFSGASSRHEADHIEGMTVVRHLTGAMIGGKLFLKRLLDVTVSATLLVAFLPVMLVAALAVKLSSPGPVFFAQKRIGFNKRVFNMYKFRTMVQDAEARQAQLEKMNEASGPVFKIRNDPRVTPVGRILRKLSIDEIPQLANVLVGDMSLVGPRPLPLRDYNGFEKDKFRRRLSVRPGITCTWQASGRNHIPFERWMEMDLEYIDRWSLVLDMRIFVKTVFSVLRGTGAA